MVGLYPGGVEADPDATAPEHACSVQTSWGSGGLDLASAQLSVDPEDSHFLMYSPQSALHKPAQLSDFVPAAPLAAGAADGLPADAYLQHLQQHGRSGQLQHQQPQSCTGMQQLTMHQQQEPAGASCDDTTCLGLRMQQQQQHQQLHLQQCRHSTQYLEPKQQQENGQQNYQRLQQHGSPTRSSVVSMQVPALNLSRVKMGSSSQVRNLPDDAAAADDALAEKEAELCFERGSIRQSQLHPYAPLQDSRCYIYKAVGRKELSDFHDLLKRLPQRESGEVMALWDALMVARHDCEVMAARGVRVSRDISRDWQETVSDLIDRVVAQDNELGQLRQQLKAMQAMQAAPLGSPSPSSPAAVNLEELHAQVVRLKRQRDLLKRDQQELSRAKAELQEALERAKQEAAAAKEQHAVVNIYASALREQHVSLLQQLCTAAEYQHTMEAPLAAKQSTALAADPDQDRFDQACRTSGGSFTTARSSCGRRSPLAGVFAAGVFPTDAALTAAPEQSLDLSCSRLVGPGLQANGRSRCTTPSPRSSSTAFSRKLVMQPVPGLQCSRRERASGASSSVFGMGVQPGALFTTATAAGGAVIPACNSDDAFGTMRDRLPTAYPLLAASREVDQYGQQVTAAVPLDVMAGAGSKGASQLQLTRPLTARASAAKLTPRLGATPRVAGCIDESKVGIWQTVEAFTHKFNVIDTLYTTLQAQ